jgi:hypothetical protein
MPAFRPCAGPMWGRAVRGRPPSGCGAARAHRNRNRNRNHEARRPPHRQSTPAFPRVCPARGQHGMIGEGAGTRAELNAGRGLRPALGKEWRARCPWSPAEKADRRVVPDQADDTSGRAPNRCCPRRVRFSPTLRPAPHPQQPFAPGDRLNRPHCGIFLPGGTGTRVNACAARGRRAVSGALSLAGGKEGAWTISRWTRWSSGRWTG